MSVYAIYTTFTTYTTYTITCHCGELCRLCSLCRLCRFALSRQPAGPELPPGFVSCLDSDRRRSGAGPDVGLGSPADIPRSPSSSPGRNGLIHVTYPQRLAGHFVRGRRYSTSPKYAHLLVRSLLLVYLVFSSTWSSWSQNPHCLESLD